MGGRIPGLSALVAFPSHTVLQQLGGTAMGNAEAVVDDGLDAVTLSG